MAITAIGESESFAYTGTIQEYVVPISGIYELTLIGGSGNCYTLSGYTQRKGGKGGTTIAYEYLEKDTTIYVVVGGKGKTANAAYGSATASGGYNGGGKATGGSDTHTLLGAAGGATHIATMSGLLSELSENQDAILAVAGGGGGAFAKHGTSTTYSNGEGGNGSGGSSVFGEGAGFGGGGLDGGAKCKGGTGYVRTTDTVDIDGTTYTPTITQGTDASAYGSSSTNGSATITLLAEIAKLTAYLGDIPVESMYLGDLAVEIL